MPQVTSSKQASPFSDNEKLVLAYERRLQYLSFTNAQQIIDEHIWDMFAKMNKFKKCPFAELIEENGNRTIIEAFRQRLLTEYRDRLELRRYSASCVMTDPLFGSLQRNGADEEIPLPLLSEDEIARLIVPKWRENLPAT